MSFYQIFHNVTNDKSEKRDFFGVIRLLLKYVLLLLAVGYVLLYVFIAISRMGYPYELEWQEGRSVQHVIRILTGEGIYVSPTIHFIPFIYTPLYFYISALAALVTGVGFLPLRLVSFLCSLGNFLIIFQFARRETGRISSGIIAAGFFAATFKLSGAWFDIARVDSLFLLLLLISIYLIRLKKSYKSIVIASIFFSLSYLTKQTALLIILPVTLYLLITDWRKFLIFVVISCSFLALFSLLFNYYTNGWYNIYALFAPYALSKYMVLLRLRYILAQEIILPLFAAILIVVWLVISKLLRKNKSDFLFYILFALGMIVGVVFSFLNVGGYNNCLIPAYAAIAILFAIGVNSLDEYFMHKLQSKHNIIISVLYAVLVLQYCMLVYNPIKQIPTANDVAAGDALIAIVKKIPGDVFIPSHPYLAQMAGKESYLQINALQAYMLLSGKLPDTQYNPDSFLYPIFSELSSREISDSSKDLYDDLIQMVSSRKFSAIILDSEDTDFEIKPFYRLDAKIFPDDDVFWTFTGVKTRPSYYYVPE